MHCHIAGPKVNAARKLRPEDKRERAPVAPHAADSRSGTLGSVPSTFATGYQYAGLGYTTAFDAAIPPLGARHAHQEFRDTPVIDKGFLVLMGNNHYVMDRIRDGEPERLRDVRRLAPGRDQGLRRQGGQPRRRRDVEAGQAATSRRSTTAVDHFGVTPRQILVELARGGRRAGLAAPGPHPRPQPRPARQLGDDAGDDEGARRPPGPPGAHPVPQLRRRRPTTTASFDSQVARAGRLRQRPSEPHGRRRPGPLRRDDEHDRPTAPLGQYLHKVTGRKWFSHDVEMETGCGVVPITYEDKNFVHALQWAIGLEWYLLVDDPWRVAHEHRPPQRRLVPGLSRRSSPC